MTSDQKNELEKLEDQLDGWCNCFNFPFQKCDSCKIKLYDDEIRKAYLSGLRDAESN